MTIFEKSDASYLKNGKGLMEEISKKNFTVNQQAK